MRTVRRFRNVAWLYRIEAVGLNGGPRRPEHRGSLVAPNNDVINAARQFKPQRPAPSRKITQDFRTDPISTVDAAVILGVLVNG